MLLACERGLALGEIAGFGCRVHRQIGRGLEEFSADALALGFDLGESGSGVLDAGIEGCGFLAQAHHLGLAASAAIGDGLFALGQIGRAGVELSGLFGEIALGLGPVHRGALLLAFHRGPGVAEAIARRGGGGMKLGTERDEALEFPCDFLALDGHLLLALLEPAAFVGVAMLHPANEARGKFVGAGAVASRLDVGLLDVDEQSFAFFTIGRQLGAFGAQAGPGIGERPFALTLLRLLLIDGERHGPRLLPRRKNPQSLSAGSAVEVEEESSSRICCPARSLEFGDELRRVLPATGRRLPGEPACRCP